ncbi:hypothetical protein CEXT_532841 [Caerostris extrusa]|uniref:Uncharacterized protein n=1 Tax=Caerostris extrusa TaxID=172846 RepID=A0AAV4XDJ2_CAEEX|nr:hypothetical protein CEXT_532841 [Caerostris extrusa]
MNAYSQKSMPPFNPCMGKAGEDGGWMLPDSREEVRPLRRPRRSFSKTELGWGWKREGGALPFLGRISESLSSPRTPRKREVISSNSSASGSDGLSHPLPLPSPYAQWPVALRFDPYRGKEFCATAT